MTPNYTQFRKLCNKLHSLRKRSPRDGHRGTVTEGDVPTRQQPYTPTISTMINTARAMQGGNGALPEGVG
jgi:hypothetical protein